MKIIFSYDNDKILDALNSLPALSERREQLMKQFFTSLLTPSSCLHHLIPEKRSNDITSRLRNAKQYYTPIARSERFKNSPVNYALNHLLWLTTNLTIFNNFELFACIIMVVFCYFCYFALTLIINNIVTLICFYHFVFCFVFANFVFLFAKLIVLLFYCFI